MAKRRTLNRTDIADKSNWIDQPADYANAKSFVTEYDEKGEPKKSKRFGDGDAVSRQNRPERKAYVNSSERGYTAIVNVYRLVDIPSGKPRRNKRDKRGSTETPSGSGQNATSSAGGAPPIKSVGDVFGASREGKAPFSGVNAPDGKPEKEKKATPGEKKQDYPTTNDIKAGIIKKGKPLTDSQKVVLRDTNYLRPLRTVTDQRRALKEFDAGKPVDIRYTLDNLGNPVPFVPTDLFYAEIEQGGTTERRRNGVRKTAAKRAGKSQKRTTKRKPVVKKATQPAKKPQKRVVRRK